MNSLPDVLYHYTTEEGALSIMKEGALKPSRTEILFSINENGKFDFSPSDDPGSWGLSHIPNIFLTTRPPDKITEHGEGHPTDYVIEVEVESILDQDLAVLKNPYRGFPHYYNIPCPYGETLKIDISKIRKVNH